MYYNYSSITIIITISLIIIMIIIIIGRALCFRAARMDRGASAMRARMRKDTRVTSV